MSDIETEARNMGWRPKEEFRGDVEKWVDAETFVDRGRHFVPILRATQRKLEDENRKLREEITGVKSLLTASQDAISALKEFQTEETRRQVAEVKKQLTERLRTAREDGNIEQETQLLDELTDLRAAEKAAKAPAPAPAASPAPAPASSGELDPAFQAWVSREENSWFGKDNRRTSLAIGIAQEMRADPANNSLVGEAFFDKVAEEVDSYLGKKPTSKVEGSRGGSGGNGAGSTSKGFSQLPAEAKAACNDMARRMVGEGRAFKDNASWQAHYAKVYFSSEE